MNDRSPKPGRPNLAELSEIARRLRGIMKAALDEAETLQPIVAEIVKQVDREITHPAYRQTVMMFLRRYPQFYLDLRTQHTEVLARLSDVVNGFDALRPGVRKASETLAAALPAEELSDRLVEAALEQMYLDDQVDLMLTRREVALSLIDAPAAVALVGMNDATYMLIGERSKYALDLNELLGDLIETVADLYVPGTGLFVVILKQFRNRMRQSAEATTNALVLAQRLYLFGDHSQESATALAEWYRGATAALDDLDRIAKTDLPAVLARIEQLR